MKVGERGQVTIPKLIRDQFGLGADTDVEFCVVDGALLLRKAPKSLSLVKWKGHCKENASKLGYRKAAKFIEDVRGR